MNIRNVWPLVKHSMSSWSDDYAPSMGAALSYYTLFSIAPLLIIVIAIAGLFFGAEAVRGVIFDQLQALMGDAGAKAIQEMLNTASHPATGGIATAASIVGLLIGATTVFNELQNDLDRIWRAPARVKSSGVWTLLRGRLLSFGMILGVAFLLTVSLVTSAAIAMLGKWWGAWFAGWETLAQILDIVINFGLLTFIFAMIYKVMPRVHVSWRDVWTGAGVTSLLFTLGKFLIGLYLGKSGMASGFGAAGSMVLVMVWVYYSAQIFLLGAEFTWVYANMYGSRREIARKEGTLPGTAPDVPTRSDDGSAAASRSTLAQSQPEEPRAGPAAASPVKPARDDGAHTITHTSPRSPHASASATHSRPLAATPPPHAALRLLHDKRVAVGIALATAVVVGLMARLHAIRRIVPLTRRMGLLR